MLKKGFCNKYNYQSNKKIFKSILHIMYYISENAFLSNIICDRNKNF